MPNCYRCGRLFRPGEVHLRRRVKTGEKYRKQYRSDAVDVVSVTFGKRIVCRDCARQIDREQMREHLMAEIGSLVILVAIVILYLIQYFASK